MCVLMILGIVDLFFLVHFMITIHSACGVLYDLKIWFIKNNNNNNNNNNLNLSGPPAWQQRLQKQIDQLRGDISIMTEYTNGNTTNKIRRKLKTILKKHKITADEQLIACKEDLKQALQAKAQRLRRYTKRSEQYKQNKMFREDSKRFYRELGKKTMQIEKPPGTGEVKKFWQKILEQEVKHNEDAQ